MKTWVQWIRSLAPWCVTVTLIGCSASQTPSPPTPPKPPTESPSTAPNTETADTGATAEAEPPAPSTPSASTPEAPESAREDNAGAGETESPEAGEEAATGSEAGQETPETGADASPGSDASGGVPAGGIPAGTTRTSDERRAGLDGQLDASLREFDGLILKEQSILEGRREETATMTGGGGSGVGDGLGDAEGSGAGSGGAGEDPDADSSNQPTQVADGTGGSPDAPPEDSMPSSPGATVDGDPAATDENGRVPRDVGDGRDDDIVARQLREAAMQEDDPALRERLWDEYRAYKKGTK